MLPSNPPAPISPGRWFLVLAVAVFLLLFSRSMTRFFCLDEHQFIAPAVLLAEDGQLPYLDYPYFHMPTLIGIYAAILGWCPYKLLVARLVSSLCGTATVLMLFTCCWRLLPGLAPGRRWWFVGGICVIYICSRLFTYASGWAWNHDTAVCCTLAAMMLHLRGLRDGRMWLGLVAGFLLGTAIGIRLSFALVVVPFAVSVFLIPSMRSVRQRVATVGLGVLGAVLALIPAIGLMLHSPEPFFFGNLEYVRLNTRFYADTEPDKVRPFACLLRCLTTFTTDPGNAALLVFFLYAGYRFWRGRAWRLEQARELILPLGMLPFLWVGVIAPTPIQYQYPYMLLPFMTISAVVLIGVDAADPVASGRWSKLVLCSAILVGVTGLPRWYWTVVQLPTPREWTPVKVHEVGEWVRANSPPGGRVLTIDPIIPMEAGMKVYPEYAVGRFVMCVGQFMEPRQRSRYRMAWGEELNRVLAERPPDAVLLDASMRWLAPEFQEYAEASGFERIECPRGKYLLWVRRDRVVQRGPE